jgi:hypothetical protein
MSKVLNVKVLQRLFILHVMHEFTYRVDGSPLVTTILQIEFMDLEGMGFALAYERYVSSEVLISCLYVL